MFRFRRFRLQTFAFRFFAALIGLTPTLVLAQPANDQATAPALVAQDSLCQNPVLATLTGATPNGPATSGCAFGMATNDPADVWFRFTAPATPGTLSIETDASTSLMLVGEIFTDVPTPSFVDCFMNFGATVGDFATDNLTPGTSYLLRVYEDATAPFPGPLDFAVCLHALPTLGTAASFGTACNDAVSLPTLTGSGEWKYVTVNGGMVLGIRDDLPLNLDLASVFADQLNPTTTGPYGTLLSRSFGLGFLGAAGPLRLRFFLDDDELQAFLNGGFSVSELLLHRYEGQNCSPTPLTGLPDFLVPAGFGKSGLNTSYLEYTTPGAGAFFLGEGDRNLPLTWGAFTGRAAPKHNELDWTTLNEDNTLDFALERSADGQTWQAIQNLPAAGSATETRHYRSVDDAPLPRAYYRVRQNDRDGAYSYSPLVLVERATALPYPNPASDEVRLTGGGELTLLDGWGRQLRRGRDGIVLRDLGRGTYWLREERTGRVYPVRKN